ncbi:MAG: DMT family transporter [Actinobacteria bacterium]|nr:DMT family transporter [Actinomycetota bacterium]
MTQDTGGSATRPGDGPISNTGMLTALIAVSTWGLAGVVAKEITMGGVALGVYRFGIYGLGMTAVGWFTGARISWQALRHSMWGGIALAVDIALFFTAIKLTTVVNATIVTALQPVVVGVVAARMFGENISKRDVRFGAVAIVGVVVVALGSTGRPEWNLSGDLAAIGALLAWSAYFVANRLAQEKDVTARQYTLCTALYTSGLNIPVALLFGQSLAFPGRTDLWWLLGLAFGAGVLGHEMMNWSLRRIPMWLGSTFTLVVPVVASAAAWVFLDEPLNAVQIAAMAVVLASLGAIIAGQTKTMNKKRPLRP